MLPIDPQADLSRKAWRRCPECGHGWQYLVSNAGPVAHVQCPGCTRMWMIDARSRRPA